MAINRAVVETRPISVSFSEWDPLDSKRSSRGNSSPRPNYLGHQNKLASNDAPSDFGSVSVLGITEQKAKPMTGIPYLQNPDPRQLHCCQSSNDQNICHNILASAGTKM